MKMQSSKTREEHLEITIDQAKSFKRLIGQYGGLEAGPLIIAIGGMHGNEPSGVLALQEVMQKLQAAQPKFKGEIVAVTGNLKALQAGQRYLDTDLNRLWKMQPDMQSLKPVAENQEKEEFEAIEAIANAAIARRKGPVIFLDLHTTSAESLPFLLIGDTLRNRELVQKLRLPVILGVEEQLDGPFMSYLNALGHIAIGFEAGQHKAASSVKNHKCLIWTLLAAAGCLENDALAEIASSRKWLETQVEAGKEGFYEVRLRHGLNPDDEFKMRKGYLNFQAIEKGEWLASDRNGQVLAEESGNIFMPLYQSQGDDGYFIIRHIDPFWLGVSKFLRKMHFDAVLRLLPGIRKAKEPQSALVMNTKVARFLGSQIMHLLGYRKTFKEGDKLHFVKRKYDLKGPSNLDRFHS
jgi:predicted deacylase